ncbi:MAG: helix-turn-helix domain-containing protein [Limnohabitans sp.]
MTYPHTDSARQNRILAAIPLSHYTRMAEHLKPVDWVSGQVVCEQGDALDFVYFPTTCTASLVSHTHDGDSSELAMIGRDGMVGVLLALGSASMNYRVVVQCSGQAYRMPARVFAEELTRCNELQQLALCYVQVLMTQMSQSIVCTGHHSVIERLCYWLLVNQESLASDQICVTHELISSMLGVRRESVTQALGKLQAMGHVASGRGKIKILQREGLVSGVCECYSLVDTAKRRLFAHATHMPAPSQALPREDADGAITHDEACLQKYQDAYDFAPVGFVTLDVQGLVLQTNLAGAIMLDIHRSQQPVKRFLDFMAPSDQLLFGDFHQEVLSGKCRRHCELTLSATSHRPEMVVRIDATLDEEGDECQLVLIDVTQEKREIEQRLALEHQQQAMLATQPYMVWFKDSEGHLISANSNLIETWRDSAGATQLEKLDAQSLSASFSAQSMPAHSRPGF